jgi:hypothetical protein
LAVVSKKSKAKTLWLTVLATVLVVLFFETRAAKTASLNLLVSGNSELAGAAVYIDGKLKGNLKKVTDSGLGGTAFWTSLPDGRYLIEVRKPGFHDFTTNLDLNTLSLVNVDLKAETN